MDAVAAVANVSTLDEIERSLSALEGRESNLRASSLRKRLDAVEKRRRDTSVFVLIDDHGNPPTDGRRCRLPGESDEACLARYGIDPTRQLCIFLDLTGARRPPK